ncbi:hypothetical protein CWE09_04785 [Aliidiomarina minuta]|uniref:DUF883 domain-containing protein n=1 Tax=Aliidiomarina minuta TaxID=880057 RepID=A0A432W7W5_9GAMM|nr:DUF883 C-terminal domain-containing protein [Aliidiomarina minuta]RUO26046.1 hypothetical protein CWE09_04785 [Aliidiomarina minuta]
MTSIKEVAENAHKGIDHAADAAISANASIHHKGQQVKATQEEWVQEIKSYVQKNPTTSIGVAVASGFILGWMLRRR